MSSSFPFSSSSSSSSTAGSPSTISEPLIANPATDDPLSLFLIQIVIILVLVRILAKMLGRLRQPPVIGEIIAGILLGPSAFGYIPGFSTTIFPTSSLVIISVFAQIGLIFFMFFLGLEVDVLLLTRNWKAAAPVAILSIIAPFSAGIGISYWFYDIEPTTATQTTFLLFMGTSFSFTAFPVLARILTSFRLLESGVGVHALSIAAIDDVLAWCVLAITLSYAGGGSAVQGVYTMLLVVAFVLVVIFIARPFMVWAGRYFHERKHSGEEFNRDYVAILFFLLACASIWTEIIGVHAFFGAFAFGVCVPKEYGLVEYLAPKIELLIVEFFLPLYFANSGLSTQLGSLDTGALWGKAVALMVIATVAKMGPVTLMTRLTSCYFFVNTVDPDESDVAVADELAAKDEEMAARGLHGDMEVGEELEMVDMIAAQHAQIAGTHAMQKGELESAGGQGDVVKADGVSDEKRLGDDEHYPSPPPPLIVDTGGSGDRIITEGGSAFFEDEERKEEDVVNVEMDADDIPKSDREGSQLSRRGRLTREGSDAVGDGTGGVRFADNPSFADASAGRVIAHPTLSGSSSGRISPSSRNSSNEDAPPKPVPIPWITCFSIGVLMNTRGLVALIALNIGLQKGILGPKVFALMVLMALATTFITSPVFEIIFYKPYMAAKRQKREDRRREAELQRRLESGGGSLSKEQEQEEELQRTARHKKEEEEEAKAREEELNRMTILVHQYSATPRSHASMFPQTPRSADVQSEKPDSLRRAHTIGAYALGSRQSVSFKQPQTLHSLYFPNEAAAAAAGPPSYSRQSSFHLPASGEPVRSSSHQALDRLGRGGGRDSRSMHNLMQTGPSRMGLSSTAAGGVTISEPRQGRTIISSRHPSDYPATHSNLMQTGPSRFHHLSTPSSNSPVHVKAPSPDDSAVVLDRQSSLLQTGPSRMMHTQYVMDDINERPAAEEAEEADKEEGAGEEQKRSQTP